MAAFTQLGSAYFGIDYFGANSSNWLLLGAAGTRVFTTPIVFPTLFSSTPSVVASLQSVDILPGSGLELDVQVQDINLSGFTLRITTWDICKVLGVGINWIAVSA
jgi:hypothetical protein